MNTVKSILTEIAHIANTIEQMQKDYEGKTKGTIYNRRMATLIGKLDHLKDKMENLYKGSVTTYSITFEDSKEVLNLNMHSYLTTFEIIDYVELHMKKKVLTLRAVSIMGLGILPKS